MPPVIHQTLDGEVIAVNLDTGVYYSLVGTAAAIWETLDGGASVEDAISHAAVRYEAPRSDVEAAVVRFIDELRAEGLVVEAAVDGPAPPTPEPSGAPFAPPALAKFTDMQELLLLDPIHEVDETGWPHQLAGEPSG
jgi:hypothetical protein